MVVVDAGRYGEDNLLVAVEAGAEDIVADEDTLEVVTAPGELAAVRNGIEKRVSRSRAPRSCSAPTVPRASSTRTTPPSSSG